MKNLIFYVFLSLFVNTISLSQINEFKISPSDSSSYGFGWSISTSGDYAIIGSPFDDDNGHNSGSAYIFRKESTKWIEEQKLTAGDGFEGDYFGYSVSISGDYVVIGAPQNDDLADNVLSDSTGKAYVFKKEGAKWIEEKKLLAADGSANDLFGFSVSISNEYIIIGAPSGNNSTGTSYLFKRDGTNWEEDQKLLASDGSRYDNFGKSVSISNEYVIVGAFFNNDLTGSAYIFKHEGKNWIEKQKLKPGDDSTAAFFGYSVSISDNQLIVGAPTVDDTTGWAYVFRREGKKWIEEQKLKASNNTTRTFFGWSVSISGDYAIVGDPFDDDNGLLSGSAYLFKSGNGTWTEIQKLTASDAAVVDYYGWSVSISGNYLSVGAPGHSAVYIYSNYITGINNELSRIPLSFILEQNYPNPFNPSTTIKFRISDFGFVSLRVYDILGNEIATLVNSEKPSGVYEVEWNASNVPSGVYFYQLKTGAFVQTKKMLLLK
jgi:hypothetical protein